MSSAVDNPALVGRDGHVSPGLPADTVREVLRRHGRLVEIDDE